MNKKDGFRDFVFRQHLQLLLYSVGLLALHYILLRIFYPHTIVIGDGHHYIRVAMNNIEISGWPIGYSKLLEGIHLFTKDDWAIGLLQYIVLEGAVIYFYFTLRYLLRPGKWVSGCILFFLLFNPFVLFISNYVLSDGLFAAFTVLWFTATLRYTYNARPLHMYLMVIFFFLAYTMRYYAMFYPLISVPLIVISRTRWWVKLTGVALGVFLLLGFRAYTISLFQRSIGQRTFSPLSGWRLAGNALIMYRHLPAEVRAADVPPPELSALHQLVLRDLAVMPPPEIVSDRLLTNYFTFQPSSPLSQYCNVFFGDFVTTEEVRRWTSVGQLYKDYGLYLIRQHPIEYGRYYVLQGIDWYFHPRVDITNIFPEGGVPILEETKKWFHYPGNWASCSNGRFYSITYFPVVVTMLNGLFLLAIAGYFFSGCFRTAGPVYNKVVILAVVFWIADFLFIILTTPYLLRYAISGMIFNTAFVPLLLERLYYRQRSFSAGSSHIQAQPSLFPDDR